jgi:two-component system, OmpR family, sensor kinase
VLNRFPIRLRLALAFALAMAAVLAAMGAFLYFRLGSSLDESVDQGLETRAAEVSALAARGDTSLDQGSGDDETFAQVLDPNGTIVDATPQVRGRPLLEAAELRTAAQQVVKLERGGARLLATPVDAQLGTFVVVVGASLEERDEALNGLLGELFVVGPIALLLASLLGYGIATAALRPVEAMRAEAAGVSAVEPGRRLPLPRARDEISRLGSTLNDMLDRLERALERERNFVADASHELRTPLALLKTELELALRNPRSQAELEQALRSAAAETDRLAQLAEDLLVLARSDQGRLPLRRESVSVRDVLSGVAARFGRRAGEAGRAIEVDAVDGLAVPADAVRLEQALGNLVENALRHGEGSIRLSAVEKDGRVELHVLDEGRGIPPDFVPRAFERFNRADQSRAGTGAGLGLAIAQVIATAHGGSAHVSARPGGGADVWLSIPKA